MVVKSRRRCRHPLHAIVNELEEFNGTAAAIITARTRMLRQSPSMTTSSKATSNARRPWQGASEMAGSKK